MKKRIDLDNNRPEFKQLSDEVSDVENKTLKHSQKDWNLPEEQQNDQPSVDRNKATNEIIGGQFLDKRMLASRQGSIGSEAFGMHAAVTPSEVGGYSSFKPAFRQRLAENKIDSQSDEGQTKDVKTSGKDETAQGLQNLLNPQSNANLAHEEMSVKQHLELSSGVPLRSLRSLVGQTNKLIRHRYRYSAMGVVYFLWDTLVTFDLITLVFHIVLTAISRRNDECWNIIICVGVINLVGQTAINIFQDHRYKSEADTVNKQRCEKFVFSRKQKRFKSKTWDDLLVGDILRIQNNQEVPADCLILDIKTNSSAEPICYVKGSPSALKGETEAKKSCQNTQNKTGSRQGDSKFVQQLSGQVRWECTNKTSYTGSLKLNENPAAFEFKSEHVVERGSFLYLTEQIICMVINVGNQCQGSVVGDREKNTQNPLSRIYKFKDFAYTKYYYGDIIHNVRIIQVVVIFLTFLSWIIVVFADYDFSHTGIYHFRIQILGESPDLESGDYFKSTVTDFAALQSQYMIFYPYLVKLVFDAVIMFHNLFILWDVNLVPSYVSISNYFALSRLSQISHMFVNPSAILSLRENVAIFRAGDQTYQSTNQKLNGRISDLILNKSPAQQIQNQLPLAAQAIAGVQLVHQNDADSSDESSRFSDDEPINELDYLPISKVRHVKFECQQVQSLIDSKEGQEKTDITSLLKACVLCHSSILRGKKMSSGGSTQKSSHKYKSIFEHDDAQLYFANSFKFSFQSRKNSIITILCQGKQEKFEELVITNFEIRGNPVTIQVLRPYGSQDAGCRILFKSNLKTIAPFIREEHQQVLDQDLSKLTRDGMFAITFAKRELDFEEASELYRVLGELQTLHKGNKQRTQEILMSQCDELDFVGTIGIKPSLNRRNSMFMEEAHRNGIKIWMLSNLSEAHNVVQINASEFLSNCTQPLNVKGQTERKVEESLKQSLKTLSDRLLQQSQEKEKQTVQSTTNRNSLHGKSTKKSKKSSGSRAKDHKNAGSIKAPLEVVFINGYALSVILKDESMLKFFLILCSLCNCVVGSQITTNQKINIVKALKDFNLEGNIGYVLSIINSSSDRFLANHTDVTIGLKQKYRSSDSLALTDMNVTELHSLTYIMFKHATLLHRRLFCIVKFFIHRTVLLATILTIFVLFSGLSYALPFQIYFVIFFTHILTPLQYFLYGISHKDYGYDQFHRIFGEYRNNQFMDLFGEIDIATVILKALFDGVLCCFFAIIACILPKPQISPANGQVLGGETLIVYTTILISLTQLKLMRDNDGQIVFFQPVYIMFFFLSALFILQDDNLVGVQCLFTCPSMLLEFIFIALILYVQEPLYKFMRMMLPTKFRESLRFYKNVEEMLFMEEYEDSDQEFHVGNNVSQAFKLAKRQKSRELLTINQNMRRIHRSDSMDQILERINMTGENMQGATDNKIVNRSTLINKWSLKLADFNKELEYQTQPIQAKVLESVVYTLYAYILVIASHMIYEVTESYSDISRFSQIALILKGIIIVVTVVMIIGIKRLQDMNYQRVTLFFILTINVVANIENYFSNSDKGGGNESDIGFFSTLLCTLFVRINSFFTIAFILVASVTSYMAIKFNGLIYGTENISTNTTQAQNYWLKVEGYFCFANVLIFLVLLILYAYWDETTKKISFVINYRKQKEFQKQKHILNILVPSIVRARIQEGQKNFSDAQGEVTIVFCDIEGFDELVQLYEGKELIELLDQTYNAFDQLCDQYGLQKIETVGKTYMACGGLKIVENKIDQRVLGNHCSVRVVDYAFEMQNFVNSITLKTGQKMRVKIGIHTGDVISGVVGETKPQFSLIGDTVNKSSRVCSKCPHNKILISKETQKLLEVYSNNFLFEPMEVFMKGIGTEKTYKVSKRRIGAKGQRDYKKITNTPGIARSKSISPVRDQKQIQKQPGNKNNLGLPLAVKDGKNLGDKKLSRSQTVSGQDVSNNEHDAQQYKEAMQTNRTNESQEDRRSDQKSNSDGEGDLIKNFGQHKEDREIVKNPTLNLRYRLVERPKFLFQFNQKEQEQEIAAFVQKFYQWETIVFLSFKVLYDTVLFFTVGWRCLPDYLVIQLAWVIPYSIINIVIIRYLLSSLPNSMTVVFQTIVIGVLLFLASMVILLCQSIFTQVSTTVFQTVKYQFNTYVLLLFTIRSFQVRQLVTSGSIILISQIAEIFIDSRIVQMQYLVEALQYILFMSMMLMNGYFREMAQRKQYNNERIIDVEIEKTEDLLSKLVPYHILAGIKNDQRVVDVLDNVTLLYTDMVGFTAYSNSVKNPQEVVQLLSRLFSKFDQLTEQHEVYKVHTIGDCYVVMGYTGKTPKYRRTTQVQIDEAYKVVKVGLEMIDIIREVRESSSDPNLKSLDMRIGIHTGRIVGGIIGTKVVRYDIFGQDVLIANKMESYGKEGCVCISENTLDLLKQNQFIMDTLEFVQHDAVEIGNIGRKIQSYLVEQIIMSNLMDSDSEYTSQDGSGSQSSSSEESDTGTQGESNKNEAVGPYPETPAN